MALESIGLGGVLTFDHRPAVQGMDKASQSFRKLRTSAQRTERIATGLQSTFRELGRGLSTAGRGIQQLSMYMLPVTAGFAGGIYQAARYEKQLSGMRSVMRGLSEQQFSDLVSKTRELGIESVFSATQAASAMEQLGILGFKHHEILSAIGPVLNAAAVAGTDLATAAQIVGGATRSMGMEIKESARVADVLTVAGQKSATTLPQMSEALTYGASAALKWGMSLEETVAILGKLADRMHQGSTGGMLMMNVVKALTAPTGQAKAILDDMQISLVKADQSGFRPLIEVITDINKALEKEIDVIERARKESILFGGRSGRAFRALADTGVKAVNKLQRELSMSMGAAEEAAKTRLDNMIGAFTLFGSSLESLSITLFSPLLKEGKKALQGVTRELNNVLYAMADLEKQIKSGHSEWSAFHFVSSKYGPQTTAVAKGLNDAMENLKEGLFGVASMLGMVKRSADGTFGPGAKAKMVEYMSTFAMYGALIAPVGLAIRGVIGAIQGLLWVMAPLGSALKAVGQMFVWALVTRVKWSYFSVGRLYRLLRWNFLGAVQAVNVALVRTALRFAAVGAAVIGVIAALYILIKHWDKIKARMEDIGATVYETLHPGERVQRTERGLSGKLIKKPKVETITEIVKTEFSGAIADASKIIKEATGAATQETAAQAEKTSEAANRAADAANSAADALKKDPCAKVEIDGREVARSVAKHEDELKARSGFKATPWQRRGVAESGAITR